MKYEVYEVVKSFYFVILSFRLFRVWVLGVLGFGFGSFGVGRFWLS
jgi:hypothetical protein